MVNLIVNALTLIFGSVIPMILKWLAKKPVVLLYIGSLAAITVTFYTALDSEFTKIHSDLPADSYFRLGLSLLPSNSMTCLSVVAAAHLARWIYLYNSKYIKSLFISNS